MSRSEMLKELGEGLPTFKDDEVDEDEVTQDWSQAVKLSSRSTASSIPKRGEKDYEPDGTNVQELLLHRARKAMFTTLANSPRGSIIVNQVKAYYNPEFHGAVLPQPKGNFLQTMGTVDKHGKCWLNFQEFVYLAERGTILPFYMNEESSIEVPLSMQDLYSLFKSQAEMDRYFIFAHLKRQGFVVTSPDLPEQDKTSFFPPIAVRSSTLFRCNSLLSFVDDKMTSVMNAFFYTRWNFLIRKYTSTQKIYEGLKNLIPFVRPPKTSQELRCERKRFPPKPNSNFSIAFNVWKPQTQFKKKSPGLPDFQVVVHNKNDALQCFPSYSELQEIFYSLDYKFEFLSEIDKELDWDNESFTNGILRKKQISKLKSKELSAISSSEGQSNERKDNRHNSSHVKQIRRLKSGYRSFLLAVIDDGLISFVKISEADFGSENVWYVPSKVNYSTKQRRFGRPSKNEKHQRRPRANEASREVT